MILNVLLRVHQDDRCIKKTINYGIEGELLYKIVHTIRVGGEETIQVDSISKEELTEAIIEAQNMLEQDENCNIVFVADIDEYILK